MSSGEKENAHQKYKVSNKKNFIEKNKENGTV